MTTEQIAAIITANIDAIENDEEYLVAEAITTEVDLVDTVGIAIAMRRPMIEAGHVEAVAEAIAGLLADWAEVN